MNLVILVRLQILVLPKILGLLQDFLVVVFLEEVLVAVVVVLGNYYFMKIGIDASRANNLQKTGVEWYSYFLLKNLKKIIPEDIEVVLYTREKLQGDLAELPKNWSNKVLCWPPKIFWTQIRLSLEMLFHKPDILFVPAHVCPIIHPKKTVMTVHDIAALRFPDSYNWLEEWYSLASVRFALKNISKIITPSQFTKD